MSASLASEQPVDGQILAMTPRLSGLGARVVGDLAARLNTDPKVIMRAMFQVALHHQSELAQAVNEIRMVDVASNW